MISNISKAYFMSLQKRLAYKMQDIVCCEWKFFLNSMLGVMTMSHYDACRMDITIVLPEDSSPSTLREVIAALRAQKLDISHDHKNWGDWLRIDGCETVISIECNHGLASSATIEHSEDDSEDILPALYRAFHHLGWVGIDEEGEYQLI